MQPIWCGFLQKRKKKCRDSTICPWATLTSQTRSKKRKFLSYLKWQNQNQCLILLGDHLNNSFKKILKWAISKFPSLKALLSRLWEQLQAHLSHLWKQLLQSSNRGAKDNQKCHRQTGTSLEWKIKTPSSFLSLQTRVITKRSSNKCYCNSSTIFVRDKPESNNCKLRWTISICKALRNRTCFRDKCPFINSSTTKCRCPWTTCSILSRVWVWMESVWALVLCHRWSTPWWRSKCRLWWWDKVICPMQDKDITKISKIMVSRCKDSINSRWCITSRCMVKTCHNSKCYTVLLFRMKTQIINSTASNLILLLATLETHMECNTKLHIHQTFNSLYLSTLNNLMGKIRWWRVETKINPQNSKTSISKTKSITSNINKNWVVRKMTGSSTTVHRNNVRQACLNKLPKIVECLDNLRGLHHKSGNTLIQDKDKVLDEASN